MPRGLNNWTYKDVKTFLKEKGFVFYKEKEGSHEAWISVDEKFVVEINFIRGKDSYPPRTLETMIRQSGISKKSWREWSSK
ncbi:MAG: hypothetical protein WC520_02550 [Candidatus Paceibacterota bacterium]